MIVFVEIEGLRGEVHTTKRISVTPTRVDRSNYEIVPLFDEIISLEEGHISGTFTSTPTTTR